MYDLKVISPRIYIIYTIFNYYIINLSIILKYFILFYLKYSTSSESSVNVCSNSSSYCGLNLS